MRHDKPVVEAKEFDDLQTPYRKSSRSAKSSITGKKSKHKHLYDKVIIFSVFGYFWANRCSVCGRIKENSYPSVKPGESEFFKTAYMKDGTPYYTTKTVEEVRLMYPEYPIFILNGETLEYELLNDTITPEAQSCTDYIEQR